MSWRFLTDEQIIDALRARCRHERLAQNLTQHDLAERAGLGAATIRRFETDSGYTPSLETFVRVLRVLDAIDALEQILPERPLDPLDPTATTRRRARPSTSRPAGTWTWGEDQ